MNREIIVWLVQIKMEFECIDTLSVIIHNLKGLCHGDLADFWPKLS